MHNENDFFHGIHPKKNTELNILSPYMLNKLSIISRGIILLSSSHPLLKIKGIIDAVHWACESFTTGPCMKCCGTKVQGPGACVI